MRNTSRKSLLVLILMGWLLPSGMEAQIAGQAKFSTTFPFTAGNTKLPAGTYTIKRMLDEEEVLEISSADGKTSAMFETLLTELPRQADRGEIVFKKYGDSYVLSEIHNRGARYGAMAVKTHAERQLATKSSTSTKETVPTIENP